MAEGIWVVIGSLLGLLGSIGTTWLTARLERQSKFPKYDEAVQKLLTEMLNGEHKWRRLDTLANVTGLSEQDAKDYLIELGARGSTKNGKLWGLTSRNPLTRIDDDATNL